MPGQLDFFVNGYDVFVTFGGAVTHYLAEVNADGVNIPVIAHQVTAVLKDSSAREFMQKLRNYWRLFLDDKHIARFINDFLKRSKINAAKNEQDLISTIYSDYLYIFVKGAAANFKEKFERIGVDYTYHRNEKTLKDALKKEIRTTITALVKQATDTPDKMYSLIMKRYAKSSQRMPVLSSQQANNERLVYQQTINQTLDNPYTKTKLESFLGNNESFILINTVPFILETSHKMIGAYNFNTGIFCLPNQAIVNDYLTDVRALNYAVPSPVEFREELMLHELEHAQEQRLCPTSQRFTCKTPLRLQLGESTAAIKEKNDADFSSLNKLRELMAKLSDMHTVQAKQLIVYSANLLKGKTEVPGVKLLGEQLKESRKVLRSFFNKVDRIANYFQALMRENAYSPEEYLTEWLGHSAQLGLTPQAEAFLLPSTFELRRHLYPGLSVDSTFPLNLSEWITSGLKTGAGSILAAGIMCPASSFYSFFSSRTLLYQASTKLLAAAESGIQTEETAQTSHASSISNISSWQMLLLAVGSAFLVWGLIRLVSPSREPLNSFEPGAPDRSRPSLNRQ